MHKFSEDFGFANNKDGTRATHHSQQKGIPKFRATGQQPHSKRAFLSSDTMHCLLVATSIHARKQNIFPNPSPARFLEHIFVCIPRPTHIQTITTSIHSLATPLRARSQGTLRTLQTFRPRAHVCYGLEANRTAAHEVTNLCTVAGLPAGQLDICGEQRSSDS